jgi:predicted dehydrogenase
MFIEKPIHCGDPAEVEKLRDIFDQKPGLIVSVGYMLRYHKGFNFRE